MMKTIYQLKMVNTETVWELSKYWHFLHLEDAQRKIKDIEESSKKEGFKRVLQEKSGSEKYKAAFTKELSGKRINLTCTEYPLYTLPMKFEIQL